MRLTAKPTYTYREFCDFARHFNQVDLLAGIAHTMVGLPDTAADPAYRRTLPWALTALAKASVLHGNAHRKTRVQFQDIYNGCAIYNNIEPSEMTDPALSPVLNFLIRMAYEQFPFQESVYMDLARAEAFFNGYSGRKPLEVLDEAGVVELLGAPVTQAGGVALVLYASAMQFGGFFDPAVIDQENFALVRKQLPREEILSVINTTFATDVDGFRRLANGTPKLANLERYMFNPFTARPLLRLDDGRLLAPVPQLILRRLSPIELYYEGLKRWGEPFTRDLGELLEDYVGRQLQDFPDATVHSEIHYGGKSGKEKKSVDWLVVFDDLVLLVEAKATRLVAAARAGAEETKKKVSATLSEAFKQIDRTRQAIVDGIGQFSHIPADRPFIALVATLDPWYVANFGARDLTYKPQVQTLVASVRSIETLVGIGQRRPVSEILRQIADDTEMSTWDLGTALGGFQEPTDTNPILDTAWAKYPFNTPDEPTTTD